MSRFRKDENGKKVGFFESLIFWGGLFLIFYLGVMPRYAYGTKYGDYVQTQGTVTKVEHFEDEDSESGNITHSYDIEVEFRVNNTIYRGKSYNYLNGTIEPQEGMQVPILYDGPYPKNSVVAKKDWLTKNMIPADDISDFWLFQGLLVLGFVSFFWGLIAYRSLYGRFVFFCGLIFIVVDGILCATVMEGYKAFLPLFPGAVVFYFITKVISYKNRRKSPY